MGKTVAVCQVNGELVENDDGTMSYMGGEAYAIPVAPTMTFDEFKSEIAEMCNRDPSTFFIKYLLPNNRRTPITVSNDKHMQRMIDFHEGSATIDVFILDAESITPITVKENDNKAAKAKSGTRGRPPSKTKKRAAAADSVSPGRTSADNNKIMKKIYVPEPLTPAGDSIASRTRSRFITAGVDNSIISAENVTPLSAISGELSVDRPRQYSSTENLITDVGQEFNSVNDFRDALRRYAIAEGFICEYIKNERKFVTAKCKAEGCPWRVHASKISPLQKFKVKTINKLHTCGCGVGKDGHPFATRLWVASIIKNKLQESPQYSVKEIMDDVYREYGITLKYHQAWSGREVAQDQLQDSQADAYVQLPLFCQKIRETNPGSIVTLVTTDELRFHRLFFSFHASQHGFKNGCRPLILLDGTSLRGKCRGTLLAAVSVDGDDGIFPVAFALVDSESYDDWIWFLAELKLAVSRDEAITFVSNRHNGLEEAVPQVFEDCHHAYSLYHLVEDFKQVLKGPTQMVKDALVDEFKRAALSCSINNFNTCIDSIRNVSPDVTTWVMESKPEHWSNAFFTGSHYDHVSSNIAEFFFSWLPEDRQLSVIQVIDTIRCRIMETFQSCQEASSTWPTVLTPKMEQRLQAEICNSHSLNVLCSSGSVFEVRDDSVNIVGIETWECTCRRWKMSGLPCVHAAAVFDRTGRNIYDYCSRYFTVEYYRSTYSEPIHPVPDIGEPASGELDMDMIVRPPRTHRPHRPRGRPKSTNKVILRKKVRLHHCSNCGQEGHNKKRCKGPE